MHLDQNGDRKPDFWVLDLGSGGQFSPVIKTQLDSSSGGSLSKVIDRFFVWDFFRIKITLNMLLLLSEVPSHNHEPFHTLLIFVFIWSHLCKCYSKVV